MAAKLRISELKIAGTPSAPCLIAKMTNAGKELITKGQLEVETMAGRFGGYHLVGSARLGQDLPPDASATVIFTLQTPSFSERRSYSINRPADFLIPEGVRFPVYRQEGDGREITIEKKVFGRVWRQPSGLFSYDYAPA